LGLLPTKALYLSNIKVGFNALLGLVHWKNFFYRPSFYFAEPSYLGFFLGFSFFFMSHQREKKGKSFSIPIVFLAGICTFSLTYLIGVALTLIVQLVNKTVFFKLKNKSAVIYLGVIAISSVYILSSQSVYSKSYLLDERLMDYGNITTSIVVRVERIKHSGSSLLGTPGLKILMGNGPGSLSGESNAWVKTIYEKGLLVLLALIFIIYNSLKSNIPLLVFTLITLHSVIILETPFFIFLLIISYTRDLTDKNPAN